jgi:regulator of protease activity HflC (stomatin/prohibitin superfamily)
MEHFGGLDQRQAPDVIAKEAYDQFIREPFRTFVRSTVARYDGLSVNENLVVISKEIQTQLADYLKGTPFEVISVVMGNASPPDDVINAISKKVAIQQVLEQKATELKIAEQEVAISTLKGKATGAALAAEAVEKAKAIQAINDKLTPLYIQYSAVQNIQGAERVYVPMQGGLPMVGTMPLTK